MQCRRPQFDSWVKKFHWKRDRLPTPVFLGFPCGSAGKESARNVGDLGSIPGLGRSPGEGNGYPLQYSGLENSIDCLAHEVTKSRTRLSDFHFTFTFMRRGKSHDYGKNILFQGENKDLGPITQSITTQYFLTNKVHFMLPKSKFKSQNCN